MAVAEKYLFDLSFDGPGGATASGSGRNPVTPAEPTFSRADLAAAEAKARATGHEAGLAEAAARQDEQIATALRQIADGAATLLAAQEANQRAAERNAIELTRSVLVKLLPTLARCRSLGEITTLVASCMRDCIDEPRLVLRLPDALFEAAQAHLAPLAAGASYPGKLIILADDTLTGSDCRVEWADGGVERDLTRTWREIETALIRAIEAPDETDGTTQPAAASGA